MDANGLRFWMLADRRDWRLLGTPPAVRFDETSRRLLLGPPHVSCAPIDSVADLSRWREWAEGSLKRVPGAGDAYETRALWDAELGAVVARGVLDEPVVIYRPPPGDVPTDLALGHDGVLYLAVAGDVVLVDLRGRWESLSLHVDGFAAWRLAEALDGGVWVLDQTQRRLGRVRGLPFPSHSMETFGPGVFRPMEENPDPPRLTLLRPEMLPQDERPIAIATGPDGTLALLTWDAANNANLRRLGPDLSFGRPARLCNAVFPHALTWAAADRIAVIDARRTDEAVAYPIDDDQERWLPSGDVYPMINPIGPFLHGVTGPPHYPTATGSKPLYPLSLPNFAQEGSAVNALPFDSGRADTVWHRVYLEAVIPPHCGIIVRFTATDDNLLPPIPSWHEHRFGQYFASATDGVPRGVWTPHASELPAHPGLLGCPRQPDQIGLFTVLIQRAGHRVRALRGRFLHVEVELIGSGQATPEIAALRAYGSRFSYVEHYLPELYRETVFDESADDLLARSTPADFLERFLGNFEGILTPLEDQIAASYLVTDALSAPEEALDWLGSWIGVAFEPATAPQVRRRMLLAAPELARTHGTMTGLTLALNIATGGNQDGSGGAVDQGQIVLVEDFRLRRTLATILGADLADETDPLLAGLAVSGNSFVGDTLVLGDEDRAEFLALFAPGIAIDDAEREAVAAFFDRLAYRLTVLVHQEIAPRDLGLIRRVVDLETPAHVLTRVAPASEPFLVGIASLIGVDSYLVTRRQPGPVTVNRGLVGRSDLILRPPSLDPRLGGGRAEASPTAVLDAPEDGVEHGASFTLDGSRSRAAPGRRIARYRWMQEE